jgi:hypothetical protein
LPLNRQIVELLLSALTKLIHHQNADILADSATAIYYLTLGGKDQIRMVADCAAIVQSLVSLLGTSQDEVKWHAFCSLGNIFVSGTDEQKQLVINCGLLGKMQALLSQENFHEVLLNSSRFDAVRCTFDESTSIGSCDECAGIIIDGIF